MFLFVMQLFCDDKFHKNVDLLWHHIINLLRYCIDEA